MKDRNVSRSALLPNVTLVARTRLASASVGQWVSKDRVQVERMDFVVDIRRANATPADLLRGDADGVVVNPAGREQSVLDAAEEIAASDRRIRDAWREGMRLDDADSKFNSHSMELRHT